MSPPRLQVGGRFAGFVEFALYGSGEIAIVIRENADLTGEAIAKPTVALEHEIADPSKGELYVKTWSENVGALEALTEAGVLVSLGPEYEYLCGFGVVAAKCRLTPAGRAEFERQKAEAADYADPFDRPENNGTTDPF